MRSRLRMSSRRSGAMVAAALSFGVLAATSTAAGPIPPGQFAVKAKVTKTVGPNGATGVSSSKVKLTAAQYAALKKKHYKAALMLQTSSDWSNAVTEGARAEFAKMGMPIVVFANSNYSAADQANAIKAALAKKPNAILTWPINPAEEAPALKDAIHTGAKIALISNLPAGFKHGADYAGVVGDDLYAMGKNTADMLANAMHNTGDVGFLYFNQNAYVVNQRDAAFRTALEQLHPKMKIVDSEGFSDPAQAAQIVSAMLLRHPTIKGIYAPWSEVATGVLQGLRSAHRNDVSVVTMDLSNTDALSLAQHSAVKGIVIDDPYSIGATLARELGLALLHKQSPAYVQVPSIKVTSTNLLSAYKNAYRATPPKSVVSALHK